jgi:flavin reductase (DIM6/NTAB) family NADH-FMN oxidoreductase RutF
VASIPGVDYASVVARVMGSAEVPLHIVTVCGGGRRDGCLVGFATQASVDPPRLLVCLSVANMTYQLATESTALAVHLVPADRHDLAELFGGETGDEVDKLAQVSWTTGQYGLPLLDDCPARMVGLIESRHTFGDHVGFLLAPETAAPLPKQRPLRVREALDVDPGHPV